MNNILKSKAVWAHLVGLIVAILSALNLPVDVSGPILAVLGTIAAYYQVDRFVKKDGDQ